MQVIVGTDDANSHDPKVMLTPNGFAISAPSGLAAIAVSHSADESERLAIPENISSAPRFLRDGSPGRAPAASASENASGYSTPERAVLLGNAGAIRPSTTNRL